MMKDMFDSFAGNLKQKTTNPFFGTFILVWIIQNWVLVFAVINFDDGFTLEKKIDFIRQNTGNQSLFYDLGFSVLLTFVILIFSYSLLNASRLIVNFFEKRVTPLVYKITDSRDVVLKDEFDNLRIVSEKLKERLEVEREKRLQAEQERDDIERRMSEFVKGHGKEVSVATESRDGSGLSMEDDAQFQRVTNYLNSQGFLGHFETIIERIENKIGLSQNDPLVKRLVKIGLIEKGEHQGGDIYHYLFSEEGSKFKRHYISKFLLRG